ncbi:MAG: hypothetical protein QXZ12_06915 [Thermoplasmata archaeon]
MENNEKEKNSINEDRVLIKDLDGDGCCWYLMMHSGTDGKRTFYWKHKYKYGCKEQIECFGMTEKDVEEYLKENSYMLSSEDMEKLKKIFPNL